MSATLPRVWSNGLHSGVLTSAERAGLEIATCAAALVSIAFWMSDLSHVRQQAAIDTLRTRLTFTRNINITSGSQSLGTGRPFLLFGLCEDHIDVKPLVSVRGCGCACLLGRGTRLDDDIVELGLSMVASACRKRGRYRFHCGRWLLQRNVRTGRGTGSCGHHMSFPRLREHRTRPLTQKPRHLVAHDNRSHARAATGEPTRSVSPGSAPSSPASVVVELRLITAGRRFKMLATSEAPR